MAIFRNDNDKTFTLVTKSTMYQLKVDDMGLLVNTYYGEKMEYMTVKEAAEKWGVSTRRVQVLCAQDRVKGAYRFGRSYMIPKTAILPNAHRTEEEKLPMPRRSPFLDMTNLYNRAGGAAECSEMLVNRPEARALFEA